MLDGWMLDDTFGDSGILHPESGIGRGWVACSFSPRPPIDSFKKICRTQESKRTNCVTIAMSVAMAANRPIPAALSAIEAATVRAAQAGDVDARETLARSCHRAAFLFALQLTGHRDDALEMSQDAMVRFFGSLGRFDSSRPVRPWLLRIVRNLARDRARRKRIRRIEPLDAGDDGPIIEPLDPSPDPESLAHRTEMQRRLWIAVQGLQPKHREVVALRDYLDLSYDEISEILRIPRGTVMSRLHRARNALRKKLRGETGKEVGS